MNNDEKEQGNADSSTIKPAEIDLTMRGLTAGPGSTVAAPVTKQRWLWPSLAILLLIAIGVIFYLPQIIRPAVLIADSNNLSAPVTAPSSSQSSSQTNTPVSSPWAEAQEARQRQESQELLSQLLKLQKELEDKNVTVWAEEDYKHILKLAADGDTAYRERNFQQSSLHYGNAVTGMRSLLSGIQTLFEANLAKGNEALSNGYSERARESFEFALLMKPGDTRALTGKQRAQTLDQVLQLITEGNDLLQNNELEPARKKYEQALALDKEAEEAGRQIRTVNARILERDFGRLMSEGYTHLQSNDLERAKSAFQRAIRMKPNASEAASALNQTETRVTNEQINRHLETAVALEKEARWNEALAEYNRALALDSNLAQAQEGRQYAANRAALDTRLEQIISEPERLANKSVYEETRLLHQQLSALAAPDPRMSRQIHAITQLLERATVPVQVVFISDNQTDVVIYRVGTLGKFQERNMTLFPGKYVALGTRQGYRDVRVEFTVETGNLMDPVHVSAAERIASR